MNRKRYRVRPWAIVALIVLLTGCWSRKEIEELSMAIGAAVDIGKETKVEQELEQKGGDYSKKNVITLTYQVVDPGPSGGTGKGGEGEVRKATATSR